MMPALLTHAQFPSFNRSEEPLSLGHWHDLHVSRTARNGILQVDKQKVVEGMAEVRRTSPPDGGCERSCCRLPAWRLRQQQNGCTPGLQGQPAWAKAEFPTGRVM